MNEQRLKQIEKEVLLIKARNKKVEGDKAWETSIFRKVTIAIITYVIALCIMLALSVDRAYLNALIPVVGYLLSTLSLPFVKKWWTKKYFDDTTK